MKKIICAIITMAMTLILGAGSFAYAYDFTQYTGTNAVLVQGLAESNSVVNILITDKSDENKIIWIGSENADDSGVYSFSFKLDRKLEDYNFIIRSNDTLNNNNITYVDSEKDAIKPQLFIKASETEGIAELMVNNMYYIENYSYNMIMSLYDENGQLIRVNVSDECTVNESGITNDSLKTTYLQNENVDMIKAFLWDADKLVPLCSFKVGKPSGYVRDAINLSKYMPKNKDLKIALIGDSITFGYGADKSYGYCLADNLNMYYKYTKGDTEYTNNENGYNCVDNYGIGGNTISASGGVGEPMKTRYNDMQTADLVIISGGTNDFSRAVIDENELLGDITDNADASTFCGGMRSLCEGMLVKYPTSQIVILTPIVRGDEIGSRKTKAEQKSFEDYVNAEIEIAKSYGIPVIDMFYPSELNFKNGEYFGESDKIHPNDEAHKIMADYIYSKLFEYGMIANID